MSFTASFGTPPNRQAGRPRLTVSRITLLVAATILCVSALGGCSSAGLSGPAAGGSALGSRSASEPPPVAGEVTPPKGWPPELAPYPQARILIFRQLAQEGGVASILLSMRSDADPATVASFYEGALTRAKWKVELLNRRSSEASTSWTRRPMLLSATRDHMSASVLAVRISDASGTAVAVTVRALAR